MTTEEYRRLIQQQALKSGEDPDEALREFTEVIRQMNAAKNESERTFTLLLELGRQYSWYRNGEPYDPAKLLDEKELGRRYAQTKARLRSVNRTLSIRCKQADALLGGGIHFEHGRPVDPPTLHRDPASTLAPAPEMSELLILSDPDDDEPIILEILS